MWRSFYETKKGPPPTGGNRTCPIALIHEHTEVTNYDQGEVSLILVGDDPKLLEDGGEVPKSQGRGWQFNSRL